MLIGENSFNRLGYFMHINWFRNVYSGVITSSANWGWLDDRGGEETQKTWWDAVDFIGVDAYYNFA